MKKTYKEELSKVELTEVQKQKIINSINLSSAVNLDNSESKIKYSKYTILRKYSMITAIITILSVTAYATEIFKLTDTSINFLKPHNAQQSEILSSNSYTINKSDTEKSGTILVKEVIGSDYQTFIFFDFIAPEGIILDENKIYRFVEYSQVVFSDEISEKFYRYDYVESKINDNIISFCYQITTPNGSLDGKKMELAFKDLKIASDEETYMKFYDEARLIAVASDEFTRKEHREALNNQEVLDKYNIQSFQGDWKIKFDVNFNKTTEKIICEDLYSIVDGLEVKIKSIDVSPISISFEMTANMEENLDDNIFEKLRSFDIYYKDGSVVHMSDVSGRTNITSNEIFIFSTFTSVINEKDIDYIYYHGAKIYIK